MGNPNAAHEPSMEEILASIRQIISEDGDQPEDGGTSAEADGAPAMAELGETGEAEAAAPDTQHDLEPAGGSDEEDRPQAEEEPAPTAAGSPDAPQPHRPEPNLRPQPGASTEAHPAPGLQHEPSPLLAGAPQPAQQPAKSPAGQGRAAVGAGGGFAAMAGPDDRRLLSAQSDESVSGAFSALAHTILAQNARTLEDLVSEMLRPMLKDWLDDNLPLLVERLVKEEIERVSRGRR